MTIKLTGQAQERIGKSELVIITERVDDVALLLAQMIKMDFVEILDRHIAKHWKQEGLSWGWMAVIWLAYILRTGLRVLGRTKSTQIDQRVGHPLMHKASIHGFAVRPPEPGDVIHPLGVKTHFLAFFTAFKTSFNIFLLTFNTSLSIFLFAFSIS